MPEKAKILNKVLSCQKKKKKEGEQSIQMAKVDIAYFVDFMAQAEEELKCSSARR